MMAFSIPNTYMKLVIFVDTKTKTDFPDNF